eukprot:NODE_6529_length_526_cov_33.483709_g6364_i0.p2 GENE.NODE_6529_length_526_cov_33.483709_g6364_i0~~NODE_6529_length_526_cov_33.483709_g6364_i0.p2  ORF type:complete len:129 (-),score=19.19 NODE_6529_length_526_cov_33.483709_g6364_i0:80-466(-)
MPRPKYVAPVHPPLPNLNKYTPQDSFAIITKGLEECVQEYKAYGVRPKVATAYFRRPNGAGTMSGALGYNFFNMCRISRMGKWVWWIPFLTVPQRVWMHQRGVGQEYDLDMENYAPYHCKRAPANNGH